jgi:hypothetical protein
MDFYRRCKTRGGDVVTWYAIIRIVEADIRDCGHIVFRLKQTHLVQQSDAKLLPQPTDSMLSVPFCSRSDARSDEALFHDSGSWGREFLDVNLRYLAARTRHT